MIEKYEILKIGLNLQLFTELLVMRLENKMMIMIREINLIIADGLIVFHRLEYQEPRYRI